MSRGNNPRKATAKPRTKSGMERPRPEAPGRSSGLLELPDSTVDSSSLRSALESGPRRLQTRYRTSGIFQPPPEYPAIHIPEPSQPPPPNSEPSQPQPHYTPLSAYPHLVSHSSEARIEMVTQPTQMYRGMQTISRIAMPETSVPSSTYPIRGFQPVSRADRPDTSIPRSTQSSQTHKGFQPFSRNDRPDTSVSRRSTRKEPPRRDFRVDLSGSYPRAGNSAPSEAAGRLQYRGASWTEARGRQPEVAASQHYRPPPPYPGRRQTEYVQESRWPSHRPYYAPLTDYQHHRMSEHPYYESQPTRYHYSRLSSGGTMDVRYSSSYQVQEQPPLVPVTQGPYFTPDHNYHMQPQCIIQPQRPEEQTNTGQFLLCLDNREEIPQRPVIFRRYIAEGFYPVMYVPPRETSYGLKQEQQQLPSTMNPVQQLVVPYDLEDISPPAEEPEETNDPQPTLPELNPVENNDFSPSSPDNPLVIDLGD